MINTLCTVATPQNLKAVNASATAGKKATDPSQDEFQKNSPDAHKSAYDTTYALASVTSSGIDLVGTSGALMCVYRGFSNTAPGAWATVGVIGATLSIATGAGMARQSSINRNKSGVLQGMLQVAQGGCQMAACCGLGLIPAIGATALWATRTGIQIHDQIKQFQDKPEPKPAPAPPAPAPAPAPTHP